MNKTRFSMNLQRPSPRTSMVTEQLHPLDMISVVPLVAFDTDLDGMRRDAVGYDDQRGFAVR
jgi:hypothetical protein